MNDKIFAELSSKPVDFVMSVGLACRTGQQIKTAGLRFTAAPLDWMQLYPLETVTHIFATGFSDFFTEIQEEDATGNHGNRRVWDTKNHISSIHHFPQDKTLEEGQADMRKTMVNRYQRVHKIMSSAKRICLMCNRADTQEELLQFLQAFSTLYPHAEIILLNIRDTADADGLTMAKYEQNGYVLYEASFRDVHADGGDFNANPKAWLGNVDCWQAVLSHIRLTPAAKRKANSKLGKVWQKLTSFFE